MREVAYLSGPMSGHPDFNFPSFHSGAKRLRVQGIEVISPHELDGDKAPEEFDWGECLGRDVQVIAANGSEVNTIRVLPGWSKSRGARLETFTAFLCGQPTIKMNGHRVRLWRLALAWLFGR